MSSDVPLGKTQTEERSMKVLVYVNTSTEVGDEDT
jgi:hypothetical protein